MRTPDLKTKNLILIELNEVNLEFAKVYADKKKLRNLQEIFRHGVTRTTSEANYEDLEPWIQWTSAHTGQTAGEHGVFRLGDTADSRIPQFFELVEQAGFKVGSISAMNAVNRLSSPAYFIPDPWTATETDGSFWSRKLGAAISQAVNDNSHARITRESALALLAGLLRFAKPKNYFQYLKLALSSRGAGWRKALFLDLFLHDLHIGLHNKSKPNFSTVFFNAGAHIQHHYFLSASEVVRSDLRNPDWYIEPGQDPFAEMLEIYDRLLGDYLRMKNVDIIVATGLTQVPYDRVKYYWRLKNHAEFLDEIGMKYAVVRPRMTRDFLIEFASAADASAGQKMLEKMISVKDGKPVFGEISNRGRSLFVTLTYGDALDETFLISDGERSFDLKPKLAFVAIKNGMHDGRGFLYHRGDVSAHVPSGPAHIKELFNVVLKHFGIAPPRTPAPEAVGQPVREPAEAY